jgi:thiamine-phosphate pyrophosphorylase
MIVISSPIAVKNEIKIIHSLLEEGLDLFHIRKPQFGVSEMRQFIKEISKDYRNRLVLNSFHEIAIEYDINKIHFSESKRKATAMLPSASPINEYKTNKTLLSTSVHSIEDFNVLDKSFEYAFLSPVFPSISKQNYSSKTDLFQEIKKRKNHSTQLIALGGMEQKTINKTLKNGFDDIALLGTIWNSKNPVNNFKLCRKIALSF